MIYLKIRLNLVLALLTLLLVTAILPATAEYPLTPSVLISQAQTSLSLLEQGKELYDAGKLGAAAQVWEQALKTFLSTGEQRNQVLSYNYLAIVYQDLGKWSAARLAITQVQNLVKTVNDSLLYAQVLNTQGSLQFNTGNAEAALKTWQQAEKLYRSQKDTTGIVLSQINQAQALQTLGHYRLARTKLEQINLSIAQFPDSNLKVKGLLSLGVTLQVVGDLERSQKVLSESLAIAKRLNSTIDIGETLLRLGNTALAREDFQAALDYYQQVKNTTKNSSTQLEALLNQFSLLVKTKQYQAALVLQPQIQKYLANIPPSRWGVYAQVNFAESLMKAENREWGIGKEELARILAKAVKQGNQLNDPRAESYALGQLGHLYEQTRQWTEALTLTRQALSLAQAVQAEDIAVNWLWQVGRIQKATGNTEGAINAYDGAVKILGSLRQDLVQMNPDVQFSFRDQVEPVYRQLVELLLQDVDNLPITTKQQNLKKSRQTIEALQLTELENFFRESCINYKPQAVDKIDSRAAIIYPIFLERSLNVIVSLPEQPLQHYKTNLSPEQSSEVFDELLQSLNPAFLPSEVLPPAQKLYDWLLRPAEKEIERLAIKTLVFVLDGSLRSLPMTVLHDGKQFMVEKYNVALTPGLQLLPSRNLDKQDFKALTAGLAQARQGFSSLPGVEQEIKQVANYVRTQVLFNQKFTRSNVEKQIESIPLNIIHLATHGQFSSKAENTFLLTWEDRINVKDFDRWLKGSSSKLRDRQPIELLVLSACQTAKGDNRAALGLAGIAVRSGARSTLATLWSVEDESTAQLIAEFYRLFTQTVMTKAEALRNSQLYLLKSSQYKHPYYWAPFVLVGNWR